MPCTPEVIVEMMNTLSKYFSFAADHAYGRQFSRWFKWQYNLAIHIQIFICASILRKPMLPSSHFDMNRVFLRSNIWGMYRTISENWKWWKHVCLSFTANQTYLSTPDHFSCVPRSSIGPNECRINQFPRKHIFFYFKSHRFHGNMYDFK